MKICLVCSQGGHFIQMMQIIDSFSGHDIFFAAYNSSREGLKSYPHAYFIDNIGMNPWRMFKAFIWSFKILKVEKPRVIVSLGAEIALPFFYWGRLLKIKTIYIESWSRVENLSLSGRLILPIADEFLVQWPSLLQVCGDKARYEGSVI
jgi:UDP-N-acetylglucosamine:LPS N-acetylglucosamine transferase